MKITDVIKPRVPAATFTRLNLFIGAPKAGKSTAMSKLPDALILDLEGIGYDYIEAENVLSCNTMGQFEAAVSYFFSPQNDKFKVLVVDHLGVCADWSQKEVAAEHNVKSYVQVRYIGYGLVKSRFAGIIDKLRHGLAIHRDKMVMLVAHALEKEGEIRIDVDIKDVSALLGAVETTGLVYSEEDGIVHVDFKNSRGVELGSRNKNLAKYNGVLDWKVLSKIAKGEKN